MRTILWVFLVVAGLGTVLVLLPRERHETAEAPLSVAAALSSDTSGYARAMRPRVFLFPADHGPHPDFRTEWWYYTGNLAGEDGRRFAYQFTLFRTALAPPDVSESMPLPASSESSERSWSTRQLYMGHLAMTDAGSGEHVAFERFSRGAAGLAGAEADPYRLWIEDWQVSGLSGADSVRIRAGEGEYSLDLVLARSKPIVYRGDRGLDPKGPEPGNASYYFSMTRMATKGTIHVGGAAHRVDGWSWMDREWSTSALSNDQVGWDWFSLQLDNDVELMYYRLRQADGSTSPYSSGSITGPLREVHTLAADDIQLRILDQWTSPSTGVRYPSEWRLEMPKTQTFLEIEPLVSDQELDLSIRYWEGAVRVRGIYRGTPVEGSGFVELTGYGEVNSP